jgi:hypothetical protein
MPPRPVTGIDKRIWIPVTITETYIKQLENNNCIVRAPVRNQLHATDVRVV